MQAALRRTHARQRQPHLSGHSTGHDHAERARAYIHSPPPPPPLSPREQRNLLPAKLHRGRAGLKEVGPKTKDQRLICPFDNIDNNAAAGETAAGRALLASRDRSAPESWARANSFSVAVCSELFFDFFSRAVPHAQRRRRVFVWRQFGRICRLLRALASTCCSLCPLSACHALKDWSLPNPGSICFVAISVLHSVLRGSFVKTRMTDEQNTGVLLD